MKLKKKDELAGYAGGLVLEVAASQLATPHDAKGEENGSR